MTAYALRHSSIIRALLAGVPVRVVAASHDTSVMMLERTYSAYVLDHSDAVGRARCSIWRQRQRRSTRRDTRPPPNSGWIVR